jgi:hypothetical protein
MTNFLDMELDMEWHKLNHMTGTKAFQSCDSVYKDGLNAMGGAKNPFFLLSIPKNHKKVNAICNVQMATRALEVVVYYVHVVSLITEHQTLCCLLTTEQPYIFVHEVVKFPFLPFDNRQPTTDSFA